MQRVWLVAAFLLASICAPTPAQTWFPGPTTGGPTARSGHAMAYDPIRGYTLMFGGSSSAVTALSDTWTWNGSTWSQLTPSASPNGRYAHAMAFDPVRGAVVLFGGRSGSSSSQFLGDTWLWNGTNWVPILSAANPTARAGHAMAFHAGLGSVLLYGGAGSPTPPIQTWSLTASGWSLLNPAFSPPSVSLANLVANPANGRTMLYVSASGSTPDFWEFTGTTWTFIAAPVVPPPLSAVVACDLTIAPDGSVLAALDSTTVAGATLLMYKWNGSQWIRRNTSLPEPTTPPGWFNREVCFAFDSSRGRSVLFSGFGAAADTWEFADDLFQASATTYGAGCGSPPLSLSASSGSRPLLGAALATQLAGVPVGLSWMSLGLSDTMLSGTFPLPLALGGFGFTGCNLYHDALVVGLGCTPSGSASASWVWQIPNQISLLGFTAFLQAYALAPSEPGFVTFSNGVKATMGNF